MKTVLSLLAAFALIGAVSCGGGSDEPSVGGNSNIGSAINSILGSSDQQGFHVEGHEEDGFDPCDLDCPDGIGCVTTVTAGTYGPASDSHEVTSDFTCDSSSADTSCMTWTMSADVTITCANGAVVFGAGSTGIVCHDITTEDNPGNIYGTFIVDGESVTCHVITSGDEGEDMSATCEDASGSPIDQVTDQECTGP